MKKFLSVVLVFLMLAVMLPTTALAAGITTDDDLIAAVNAAADGDTITLGEGTFDLEKISVKDGRNLTFVGAGQDKTTLNYGNEYKAGYSDAGGVGCYSFDGAGKITFKSVTLHDKYAKDDSSDYYRGFIRPASMSFEDCKITNVISMFGNGAVTFKGCLFESSYTKCFNVKCYTGTSFSFDGCTFKSPYGFIDAYRQNTLDGVLEVKINNCQFIGTGSAAAPKPAVRLCDYKHAQEGGAWNLGFTGNNTTENIAVDSKTGSALYGCRFYEGYELLGTVSVDGTTVWTKGEKQELPPTPPTPPTDGTITIIVPPPRRPPRPMTRRTPPPAPMIWSPPRPLSWLSLPLACPFFPEKNNACPPLSGAPSGAPFSCHFAVNIAQYLVKLHPHFSAIVNFS